MYQCTTIPFTGQQVELIFMLWEKWLIAVSNAESQKFLDIDQKRGKRATEWRNLWANDV